MEGQSYRGFAFGMNSCPGVSRGGTVRGSPGFLRGHPGMIRGRPGIVRGQSESGHPGIMRGITRIVRGRPGMSRGVPGIVRGRPGMSRGLRGGPGIVRGLPFMARRPPGIIRGNRGMSRGHPGMIRGNTRMARGNTGMARGHQGMIRGNTGIARGQQGMARGRPGMARGHPGMARVRPQMATGHLGNTVILRGRPQMARGIPVIARGHQRMVRGHPVMARGLPGMIRGSAGIIRGGSRFIRRQGSILIPNVQSSRIASKRKVDKVDIDLTSDPEVEDSKTDLTNSLSIEDVIKNVVDNSISIRISDDGKLGLLSKNTINKNITVSIVNKNIPPPKNNVETIIKESKQLEDLDQIMDMDVQNIEEYPTSEEFSTSVNNNVYMDIKKIKVEKDANCNENENNPVTFEPTCESTDLGSHDVTSPVCIVDLNIVKGIIDGAGQEPYMENEEEILYESKVDVKTEIIERWEINSGHLNNEPNNMNVDIGCMADNELTSNIQFLQDEEDEGLGKVMGVKSEKNNFIGKGPCSICGKMFSDNYKFNRHMTSHTGEKPFSCDHCGKHFSRKDKLNNHQKLHW